MSSGDHIVLFRRASAELHRRNLERFARALRDEVAKGADFQCLITDDRELRRLNREFLGRDYATDVLSFAEDCGGEDRSLTVAARSGRARSGQVRSGQVRLGELAISAQRARAQAGEYGHSIDDEICILMLHGLLHLMGMDHEKDRGRMARAEARWRTRLGLPAGLIERVRA